MNKTGTASHPQESIIRGALLAYLLLFLHVVLIVGLGVFMFFFGGFVTYLPWILAIGGCLILASVYLWWKHVKKRGKKLRNLLNDPLLQGRSVEISFLGGFFSVRFGYNQEPLMIGHGNGEMPKRLGNQSMDRSEQLANLGRLLKEDLITIDEYLKAKKELMGQ